MYVGFKGEGEGSMQKRTSVFMASWYCLKGGGGVCKSPYLGVRTLWMVSNFVKKDIPVQVIFTRCFGEMCVSSHAATSRLFALQYMVFSYAQFRSVFTWR